MYNVLEEVTHSNNEAMAQIYTRLLHTYAKLDSVSSLIRCNPLSTFDLGENVTKEQILPYRDYRNPMTL